MDRRISELNQWLLSEELNGRGTALAGEELCSKLCDMGIPISRAHALVLFLHPLYHARGTIWTKETGLQEQNWAHGLQDQPGWTKSVFYDLVVNNGPARIHFDLRDPDAGAEFPMMKELRSEGITEYLAFRMQFSDGSRHAASFATDSPHGFSEEDRNLLLNLDRLLAIRLEHAIRRELLHTLLTAYLGKDAAQRVLDGRIRREDIQSIDAVIWMSDLRDFTRLSDQLEPSALLGLLGDYFSVVVDAVRQEGGEVLKFIGDAVLAVFRVESRTTAEACEAAARATQVVEREINKHNTLRRDQGDEMIKYGIGLHQGTVNYGNVGSAERLDFTVIGPAVNMTARIEGLCGQLEHTVLMSQAVAKFVSLPTTSLGPQALKGVEKPVEIYSLSSTTQV